MKRKTMMILGSIVGLLLVTVIAVPMFIDAERFRPMVQIQAKAALGRGITLGKLDFSLLSGGVVASDVTIADDPAFSRDAFLTAKSLKVGVEIWPMILSREVRVTSVVLDQPQIQMVRSASGKWNFDSLGATPAQKKASDAAGKRPSPASFFIQDLRIEHGKITIAQAGKKRVYDDVNVKLQNFSNNSSFPFMVDATTPGGGSVRMDGEAGPIAAGDITQTPLHANIKVENLDLAATGFAPPDSGSTSRIKPSMATTRIDPPSSIGVARLVRARHRAPLISTIPSGDTACTATPISPIIHSRPIVGVENRTR